MVARLLACIALLSLTWSVAYAADPTQLQDFGLGPNVHIYILFVVLYFSVFVNGQFCKNPEQVVPEDFLFKGLNVRGDTKNHVGSKVTLINVDMLPGLNTLGISMARVDYNPYGLNPPHIHPRATEVQTLIKGTLYVGFVTSNDANGRNKFITKVLYPGDVFVFPQGLIHFQFNIGNTPALAISGLSSQNPGAITIANATFGSNPPISPDVLSKAFQLDKNIINYLQSTFAI